MYQKSLRRDIPEEERHGKSSYEIQQLDFSEKHDYYFRFEKENHHAGEYQNYIDYYADEVKAGRTPKPDLREGIRTVAIVEAARRSLSTGAPARVSDILRENGLEELIQL